MAKLAKETPKYKPFLKAKEVQSHQKIEKQPKETKHSST
jgi:hypothetical protein